MMERSVFIARNIHASMTVASLGGPGRPLPMQGPRRLAKRVIQNARSTLAKSGTVGATPNAQENETGRYSLIADTLPATTRQTPSFCTQVRR